MKRGFEWRKKLVNNNYRATREGTVLYDKISTNDYKH